MTAEEEKGRRITIAIALLAGGWPVVILVVAVFGGVTVPASAWVFRAAVPLGLAWLLVRGRRWVRAITVIGFAMGAMGALARMSQATTPAAMFVESTVATVETIAAAMLSMSPAVRVYFQARNHLIALNLTRG